MMNDSKNDFNMNLDPTYLRHIYNGLSTQKLNPENEAALPKGLSAIYDQELKSIRPLHKRQEVLDVLAVFALAQDTVSAAFVATVLAKENDPTSKIELVNEVIARFSKWFNADEGGKLRFAHERLRLLVLGKMSKGDLLRVNKIFVEFCSQWATHSKRSEELRIYPLVYRARHLAFENNLKALYKLSNDKKYIQEQKDVTFQFDATFNLYQSALKVALIHNDIEKQQLLAIKIGNWHVDLQNSYLDVIKWAKVQNTVSISNALKRIELFDEKKKFLLYLQILSELLLVNPPKEKKELCQMVIVHMDANLPKDPSVFDWSDYAPAEYIVLFLMELWHLEIPIDSFLYNTRCPEKLSKIELFDPKKIEHFALYQRIVEAITDKNDKNDALLSIVKFYREQGDNETAQKLLLKAQRIAESIPDENDKSEAFYSLVKFFIEQGDVSSAERIAESIPGENDKNDALLSIVKFYREQGDNETAQKLLLKAQRIAESSILEHAPDEALLKIVEFYLEQGDVSSAERLAESFNGEYIEYRVEALLSISKSYIKQGDNETAQKKLLQVQRIFEALNDEYKSHIYIKIINFYLEQGDISSAQRLEAFFNEMQKNKIPYRIVEFYIKQGDVSSAERLAAFITDKYYKTEALVSIVEFYLEQQDNLSSAQRIALSIPDEFEKNDVLLRIVKFSIEQGDVSSAERLAETITDEEYKIKAFLRIVNFYLDQGDYKPAQHFLLQAQRLAESFTNEDYKNETLHRIVHFSLEQGNIVHFSLEQGNHKMVQKFLLQAERLAESIPNAEEDKVGTFLSISKSYMEIGNHKMAQKVLLQAERLAESIPEYVKIDALLRIVKFSLEQGDHETAQNFAIQASRGAQINIDKQSRLIYFDRILDFSLEQEDVSLSLILAEAIPEEDVKNDHLNRIFNFYLAQEDVSSAERLAESIPDEYDKSNALLRIVDFYLAQEDISSAERLAGSIPLAAILDQAFTSIVRIYIEQGDVLPAQILAEDITCDDDKIEALLSIVEFYLEQENHEMAEKFLLQAQKLAESISDESEKSRALLIMVKFYLKQGDVSIAQRLSEAITDEDYIDAHISVVDFCLEMGDHETAQNFLLQAQRLAESIPDKHDKFVALLPIRSAHLRIFDFFIEQGDVSSAERLAETIIDEADKIKAFLRIVKLYREQGGEYETAQKEISLQAQKMTESISCKNLPGIVDFSLAQGDVSSAEIIAETIINEEHKFYKIKALLSVVKFYIEENDYEMAQKVLLKAQRLAETIIDEKDKIKALISIAKFYLEMGDKEAIYLTIPLFPNLSEKRRIIGDLLAIPSFSDLWQHILFIEIKVQEQEVKDAAYKIWLNRLTEDPGNMLANVNKVWPKISHNQELTEMALYNMAIYHAFVNKNKKEGQALLKKMTKVIDVKDWIT